MGRFKCSATEFTRPPTIDGRLSKVLVVESNPAAAEIEVLVPATAGHEGSSLRALQPMSSPGAAM